MEPSLQLGNLVELAGQHGTDQLQQSAGKIHRLDFLGEDCKHHALFKDISFPLLEHISIDASDYNEPHLLEPYLQSRLKSFRFYGGFLSDDFLQKLQEICPLLEEVLIDNPRNSITPEGFMQFLAKAQNLQNVTILYGMDSLVTDDVFANLATRSGLRSLGLGSVLTPRIISYSQGRVEHRLFPDLQNLTCTASLDGAIALSIHLSQLTRLEISLLDTGKALEELRFVSILSAACPNLQHLDIRYTAEKSTNLQARDILALQHGLQHLKYLNLSGNNLLATSLQDADMSDFAKVFGGQMEVLCLGFSQCALTEETLRAVGEYMGDTLVKCELGGTFNLSRLNEIGDKVLFPVLKDLTLGNIIHTVEPKEIADTVQRYAPLLELFDLVEESKLCREVEKVVREVLRGHN